ncbi:MAG: molybdenum cofactor guanylyltransferase, partial [Proteobacteria bacterium]|nr:molybdenum cofactor guanylyltransferase [Pseudomonadota bacterium]
MKTSGDIAGVILAGGRGERMGGLAKAFLEVGGGRAIDRLLTVYQRLFDEIVVAVRDREGFEDFGVTVAVDQVAIRSSLTGIHAGLWASKAPFVFVAPCDMPFLQPGLVQSLLAEVDGEADVVIPLKENGRVEPLCAVYSKSCLPHIKKQLEGGD